MFSCTRRPSKKIKEKVLFRIQFHATQIPHTSWDRLAVSLISLDSGRVTTKTRKASVRNGQCQWPDAVSETIKLVLDSRTMQYDERLYKFAVAKGFSRSCVLGEVIINMAEYVSAGSPLSVTLPLRFCYAGTLLHVTIQCLTPKCTEKPYSWLHSKSRQDGQTTDAESEFSCKTPSPGHRLFRTFSVGPQSPTAASPSGEFSRKLPPSPTISSAASEKKSGLISISYISLSSPANAVTPPPQAPKQAESSDLDIEAAYQWKMFAEKLQEDMEAQKVQHASVQAEAGNKISSLIEEREEFKSLNEKLLIKEKWKNEEYRSTIQELKDELELEKQANSGLTGQLNKVRDSNLELLLAVRDLEDSMQEQAKDARYGMNCKIYNNPCAEGAVLEGEEGCSEASYAAETKDKNIDRIIDLNRTAGDADDGAPAFKVLISAFAEDLRNMRVVLSDLGTQPDSVNNQLMQDLEAVVQGSQSLVAELQKQSPCNFTTAVVHKDGGTSRLEISDEVRAEIEEKTLQLQELDLKVMHLTTENARLEKALNNCVALESNRRMKMDQLESQLVEFAQELDFMQESNEQLESAIVAANSENQRLEKIVSDTKAMPECSLQLVASLEARIKHLEEEKEASFLENCVGENLARDLCEQLQKVISRSKRGDDSGCQSGNELQRKDFICQLKELRTLFSALVKNAQESESRMRELQSICDSLEDRLLKENEKAMATISFLDEQFGQLSKESDQLIGVCKQEVERILSKLEQEKSQGFLRLALEENMCEIAYLRDALRKFEEQVRSLAQEKEVIISNAQVEAQRLNAGWETKYACSEEALKKSQASVIELENLKSELNKSIMESKVEKVGMETVFAADIEKLQEELGDGKEKLMETREYLKLSEQEAASLKTTTEDLLADKGMLKAELEKLVVSLDRVELEKSALETKLKLLDAENTQLHVQNAAAGRSEESTRALEADLEYCKTLMDGQQQEVAFLRTRLRSESQSHEEVKALCVQLTTENEKSKSSLHDCLATESELDIRFQKLQETVEAKLHSLELDSQSCRQDSEAKSSLISEKLSSLEAAYKQTKISFDAVTFELEQCKHRNAELEQIIQKVQVQPAEEPEANVSSRKGKEQAVQLELQRSISEQDQMEEESQDESRIRRKWKIQHEDQESELKSLREKVASLEIDLSSKVLHSSIDKSREREAILCEKIVHLEVAKRLLEGEAEEWKLLKANLEESLSRFQSQLQIERSQLAEKESQYQCLKKENEKLKAAVSDWEKEKEQLMIKVQHLESEARGLLKTIGCKEGEALAKQAEADSLRRELQDKEAFLWEKIEYLEIANEQLAFQQADSDVDQLKMELTRLQNHNSELTLREHELSSKLSAHSLLQVELQRLQEENEQLERNFVKLKDSSHWGDTVERLVYLEAELAEALETNNIYKLQLQNTFLKQERGQDVGDVEEMVGNLVRFKKQTSFLETELKEIQERYLNMSMKFAELQTEREELLMTVKALRNR